MLLAMSAAGLFPMLTRMRGVALGSMGVVRGLFVTAALVVLSSLLMVLCCVRLVLRGMAAVVGSFFRHGCSPC